MSKKTFFHNKKITRILGASSLAIMMGASVLCGVLIAPMNSAQATISSPENATTNLTAEEQAKAEHDAKILAGGDLGLDPENDPVVFTTQSGIQIRSHDTSVSGSTVTVGSTSWKYVTFGSYKWIIIGYSTNAATQDAGYVRLSNYDRNTYTSWLSASGKNNYIVPDSSVAGEAVFSDINSKNDYIYLSSSFTYILKTIFTNATPSTELPANCVLCLCEKITGTTNYGYEYSSYYPGSALNSAMINIYNSISSAANGQIQSTLLTTARWNSNYTITHSEYLFPLAQSSNWSSIAQNYCVETYLSTGVKRIAYNTSGSTAKWWLRSGGVGGSASAYFVSTTGTVTGTEYCTNGSGIRPAFVLSLA